MKTKLPTLNPDEIYVGAIGNQKGELYHLILLPGDNNEASQADQLVWAKSIGGDLPNKIEMAMLWNTCRDQFQKDWYWSNQTHEIYSECARYQNFGNGHQGGSYVSAELRGRAVRRIRFGEE
ncbi:DUF1566 domain-containing protein [Pusillimonas minor]|uniref:DUF1566 domain-containing protein n=1 Tax=Pusillimonas minor TaxID=2697024 RepID=A0A842HJY0_9BURK|nr:DUF1566 domain-containing protein [Pusillimonas minor]MBC2768596.1 DUF1566 domain-containing protein [Pusillimonas minor]